MIAALDVSLLRVDRAAPLDGVAFVFANCHTALAWAAIVLDGPAVGVAHVAIAANRIGGAKGFVAA